MEVEIKELCFQVLDFIHINWWPDSKFAEGIPIRVKMNMYVKCTWSLTWLYFGFESTLLLQGYNFLKKIFVLSFCLSITERNYVSSLFLLLLFRNAWLEMCSLSLDRNFVKEVVLICQSQMMIKFCTAVKNSMPLLKKWQLILILYTAKIEEVHPYASKFR